MLDERVANNLDKALGGAEEAKRFEKITMPEKLYLICETFRVIEYKHDYSCGSNCIHFPFSLTATPSPLNIISEPILPKFD